MVSMKNSELFDNHFGAGWNLEDLRTFEYALSEFNLHQSEQNWVHCWLEIHCRAPFFAMPEDTTQIDNLYAMQSHGADVPGAIAVYEAKGDSLVVYVLAERSGALEMPPDIIPTWLAQTNSLIVASLALYAFGSHGRQFADKAEWDRLDQLIESVLASMRPSLSAWWNVFDAVEMIFQGKAKDDKTAVYHLLHKVFTKAAKDLGTELEALLTRLAQCNTCHFDTVLVPMLEELPKDRERILGFMFTRYEKIRGEIDYHKLPSFGMTYLDFYLANSLALAFMLDESYGCHPGQSWILRQLAHAAHPARAWERDWNIFQQARWSLWLFTAACMGILRTANRHAEWAGQYNAFVRSILEIGRGRFWIWRRRIIGQDELAVVSADLFFRVLLLHPSEVNELRLPEHLTRDALTPQELDLVQALMDLSSPDVVTRCKAHRERLLKWWEAI